MKLLITGTRKGRPDVARWIERFLLKHDPSEAIVGDAAGVDTQAFLALSRVGVSVIREVVTGPKSDPRSYHDRNQRMADHCGPGDACLAFPDGESRGTWDCVRRCRERGMRVYVLPMLEGV